MEWIPTIIALVGAPLAGYIGVVVGNARMEERQSAMKEKLEFIHNEVFGTNKIKDRLHKAEVELIFQKHELRELKK